MLIQRICRAERLRSLRGQDSPENNAGVWWVAYPPSDRRLCCNALEREGLLLAGRQPDRNGVRAGDEMPDADQLLDVTQKYLNFIYFNRF